MLDITKDYENFIANKGTNKNGQTIFNKIIKKVAKPKVKQRSSK